MTQLNPIALTMKKNSKIDLEFNITFTTKVDAYLEPVMKKVINQVSAPKQLLITTDLFPRFPFENFPSLSIKTLSKSELTLSIISWLAFGVVVILTLAKLQGIDVSVSGLINPEYWAFRQIVK